MCATLCGILLFAVKSLCVKGLAVFFLNWLCVVHGSLCFLNKMWFSRLGGIATPRDYFSLNQPLSISTD